MEQERPRVRAGGQHCPYCKEAVEPEQRRSCAACKATHHAECWDELGRCATCRGDVAEGAIVVRRASALSDACLREEVCALLRVPPLEVEQLVMHGRLQPWPDADGRTRYSRQQVEAIAAEFAAARAGAPRSVITPAETAREGVDLVAYVVFVLAVAFLVLLLRHFSVKD